MEDLMKPRFKVIADYPNSKFNIGDILVRYYFQNSSDGAYCYVTSPISPLDGNNLKMEYAESMPHLFKKLEWWEERAKEDMPMFVKYVKDGRLSIAEGVYKVDGVGVYDDFEGDEYPNYSGFAATIYFEKENKIINLNYAYFKPATEAEYEAYLKTTKP